MSFENGHCDECGTPIGSGLCQGCLAYSAAVACEDYIGDDVPDSIEGCSSFMPPPTEEHVREWRKLKGK